MTQLEKVIWEMRKRGGRITTWELLDLHFAQYQRVLSDLRKRGYNISEAQPIEHQPGNFLYAMYEKEKNGQLAMFG